MEGQNKYSLREVGLQYKLSLPPCPQRLGPSFPILSKSAMPTRWMADISAHKSGLLLHPQLMKCRLYNIYQIQCIHIMRCIMYLPDSVYPCGCVAGGSDSTQKRGVGRQQQEDGKNIIHNYLNIQQFSKKTFLKN